MGAGAVVVAEEVEVEVEVEVVVEGVEVVVADFGASQPSLYVRFGLM